MPLSLSSRKRYELSRLISGLPQAEFEQLRFALNPPAGILSSSSDAQGNRGVAMLAWAEGPTGPGIDSVLELLNDIAPGAFTLDGQRATSPDNLALYRYKRTNKGYTEDLDDGVTLTLMLIPAGEFIMGAPDGEPDSSDAERPQHRVELQTFLMGRYPVTQDQWRVVAGYNREDIDLNPDPSSFKGDDLPVERVNWHEATEFCKRLSTRTGKNYHLPSEAQWEYACRAKTETAYHFGPKLTEELAHYNQGLGGRTTPVGQYPANQWGLHDMHGNVSECCQDYWHDDYEYAPTDGSAWIERGNENRRVRRGGSWVDGPGFCRSAYRDYSAPDNRYVYIGFRVCCSAPRTLTPPTD